MSHLRALLGAVAAMTAGLVLAVPAQAIVVPVDPGPIAAGRPIWGSGQNLMSVNASEDYWVGPLRAREHTPRGAAPREPQLMGRLPSNAPAFTNHSQSLPSPTATHTQLIPGRFRWGLLIEYSQERVARRFIFTDAVPDGLA